MKRFFLAGLILLSVGALRAAEKPQGAAAEPRGRFNALLEKAKANPADQALRKQVIEAAAKLRPKPAIPKEATRHFVMAATFQKEAKTPEDFAAAAKSYEEALAVAPWWPEAYYNRSVALESAQRFDEAKAALEMYLLSMPKDAEVAERRLYALDAKTAMAARAAKAAVERPKDPIEGYWFMLWNSAPWQAWPQFAIERRGDAYELRDPKGWCSAFADVSITEREVRFTCYPPGTTAAIQWVLSLQGDDLAGTNFNPKAGVPNPVRFIRKDWNP